jgi:DNA-directed RNA polymerase specialized sigma24 family protein
MKLLKPSTVEKLLDKQENQKYLTSFHLEPVINIALNEREKEIVRDAVASLNNEMKTIIHLRFWEDRSIDEISHLLRKRKEKIEQMLSESLDLLKETVEARMTIKTREEHIKNQ